MELSIGRKAKSQFRINMFAEQVLPIKKAEKHNTFGEAIVIQSSIAVKVRI